MKICCFFIIILLLGCWNSFLKLIFNYFSVSMVANSVEFSLTLNFLIVLFSFKLFYGIVTIVVLISFSYSKILLISNYFNRMIHSLPNLIVRLNPTNYCLYL